MATVAVTRRGGDQARSASSASRATATCCPSVEGNSLDAATDKADAYLDQYAANFGARPGELVRTGVAESAAGWTVTYTQSYKGVDVFGSMLQGQVDHEGDLTSVNGYAAPDLSLSVDPRISAADAGKRAVGLVREDPPAHDGETADLTGIAPTNSELVVYRMGATRGEAGTAVLAYQVEVTNDDNIRDAVFIDASTGKVAQPLVDGARRPRAASSTRPRSPGARPTGCGRRATRSRAPSTPTSRTSSTPPVSPTGSSRTRSVATPTTATAP